jgi:hypothetical protein
MARRLVPFGKLLGILAFTAAALQLASIASSEGQDTRFALPSGKPGFAIAAQGVVRVTLTSNPVDGQSREYRFVAEITGGPDNNPDLYCVEMTWGFGDGPAATVTPSCAPWTPDVRIPRRFERSHTYEQGGSYNVTFTYGPLSAQLAIDVT